MLHRLILQVTKFQLPTLKRFNTKTFFFFFWGGGGIMPPCQKKVKSLKIFWTVEKGRILAISGKISHKVRKSKYFPCI